MIRNPEKGPVQPHRFHLQFIQDHLHHITAIATEKAWGRQNRCYSCREDSSLQFVVDTLAKKRVERYKSECHPVSSQNICVPEIIDHSLLTLFATKPDPLNNCLDGLANPSGSP